MMSQAPPLQARTALERIFRAALDAVAPDRLLADAIAGTAPGTEAVAAMVAGASGIYILAAGKAALAMGCEAATRLKPKLRGALAIVPKDTSVVSVARPSDLEILEAAHPIPDQSSLRAARAALAMAARACDGDLLLVALSGGASAMLAMPAGEVSLEDKIAVTSALLRAGATVGELNLVRKHLSAIKGGGLLRAVPDRARVLTLIISDVSGNDLATIGSGPTAADPSTYSEAIAALKRHHGVWGRTPEPVREHLELGAAGRIAETVKPGDPLVSRATNLVIADNSTALAGARNEARALGYAVDAWRELRGEANDLGRALAAHLCALNTPRLCVIAGGEPVVTVKSDGRGGRAQQCALALALELARIGVGRRIAALFAGTDGIDGPTDAAGAFAAPDTIERARAHGVDAEAALARNDSYTVFKALGDLIVTGPTGTNVADIFVGLVNY